MDQRVDPKRHGFEILRFSCQVSSPTIIVERAGSYAWAHKSWRVREEFARTVTSAIGLFASTELPLQRVLLSPVCLFPLIRLEQRTLVFVFTKKKYFIVVIVADLLFLMLLLLYCYFLLC